jgi:PLD-like domain
MAASASNGTLSVIAHRGDAKTLLAFDLPKSKTKQLAGFTIEVKPGTQKSYYLFNQLQFKQPADHAQDPAEPANSSVNAPIHKFRWLHVPGQMHQGLEPHFGTYAYTVTARYFDAHASMLPLDKSESVTVKVQVAPFQSGHVGLGFTRGFTQSQAFVRHFGLKAKIRPAGKVLLFDTAAEAGVNAAGEHFTYEDAYRWLGFTARDWVLAVLDDVLKKKSLQLDVFAYDLNEPGVIERLLKLAKQGRARVILDNAALHHNKKKPKSEDAFETLFAKAAKGAAGILRGKFGRYAHDKVFIVSKKGKPGSATRVLTGSTNFSVTGLYVNSNHVLVFDDQRVARTYAEVFEQAWADGAKAAAFRKSPHATGAFSVSGQKLPPIDVTFSPHDQAEADRILDAIAKRIAAEGKKSKKRGSVLFAVMQVDGSESPVYKALKSLHAKTDIFSYGISDSTNGISLYRPKSAQGVLVTGKPARAVLPPPFNQVPGIGLGHQVHHKFVVCGFNREDPVVYCGSSNLASGGEVKNGDNLLAIHDGEVATVFAIEALALVDHFDFLDRLAAEAGKKKTMAPPAAKAPAAVEAGWFLSTSDRWTRPYYDSKDLRCVDRKLFAV